ncbi:hypothetical protein [Microvirga lotononidis]|uniref:Outer membrane protein beta-barrel domain-containing protein n=1 Tax=Microvirga lotononidis TaxID=864069 RepID=I4YWV3_9HYPH|nr:hypothetical protein [Microvirga lotononidis]EIM28445.1 hypothetical protein MicloDRAFT_00050290 [Microvirga lotononidis]WQO27476.1 hypothetical protein U0023_23035 [Microvirga lotononidis]
MRYLPQRLSCGPMVAAGLVFGGASSTLAADLGPPPAPVVEAPALPSWTYRFTPYGWLLALNGTETIRGRSVKVDASFADIVKASDTLVALMGDFEARNGPVSLFTNAVWANIGVDGNRIRSRSLAPGVTGALATSLSLDIDMAIIEAGAAYEVYRSGPLAFDLLAGARYWHQSADLSLAVTGAVSTADLDVVGSRALAHSGSVDWVDPMIGGRIRYTVSPGHELLLRGDIGGFGLGSDFSWQAIGAYGFELGTYQGVTFSGVVGYRALYVDYSQGEGRQRYQYDMLQHGPVLGISARF